MLGSDTFAGILQDPVGAYSRLVLVGAMMLLAVMAARSVVTRRPRPIPIEDT